MNYANITYPDINNGLGCRVTLWISGCSHKCEGCHNPRLWNRWFGKRFTDEDKDKLFNILSKPYIQGLTLSGGDPLESDITSLLKEVKEKFPYKDIWVYTGYLFEDICNKEYMQYIDVLVDGLFIKDKKDISLAFRGSSNQRIIDVKKSLKQGKAILNENF